jgi:SAM-dependent methyltransferase
VFLEDLLKKEVLVSPRKKERLHMGEDRKSLVSAREAAEVFPILNQRPVLFSNLESFEKLRGASDQMQTEYYGTEKTRIPFKRKLKEFFVYQLERDFRPEYGQDLLKTALESPGSVCVAVGGGPTRHHPRLINVNIDAYPNVDIVADAHELPFADNSLDAVFCEAVLEHVADPAKVVSEIFRCLKPGGLAYSAVPFLQAYHGYPHHYQNFTITGHERLYKVTGFEIKKVGVQTGPFCMMSNLLKHAISAFVSVTLLRRALLFLTYCVSACFQWLDYFFVRHPRAFVLASSTYLLAQKPSKME